jgi:hypothetical protein
LRFHARNPYKKNDHDDDPTLRKHPSHGAFPPEVTTPTAERLYAHTPVKSCLRKSTMSKANEQMLQLGRPNPSGPAVNS